MGGDGIDASLRQGQEKSERSCWSVRTGGPNVRDVIFLISDASFQWKEGGSLGDVPWEEIAKIVKGSLQGTEGCTLNFIGFEMKPEDRRRMESVLRSNHGKIREIK